ncbi:sulfotransferase [gamma proteobacterium NOR5-3]|nr:sulfotransferase [gamma proteobacterium NOR5-3]
MTHSNFKKDTAQAVQERDFPRLLKLCRAAQEADPLFADAWFLESVAAEAGRDMAAAIKLVSKALELSPGNIEYLVQKARYHSQVSQDEAAKKTADAAIAAGPRTAQQLDTLGVVLTRLGDYLTAANLLRNAAAAAPKHPQIRFNLAAAEQFLGNDAAAVENYEAVIRLAPGHARSYWALSELQKNKSNTQYETSLRTLAANPRLSDRDSLYVAHALARIEESRGDTNAAIKRLVLAKAHRRKALQYDFTSDQRMFNALQNKHYAADNSPAKTAGHRQPLFIVGMPRTGTTLLERMLTAHPLIATLGEQQALPQAVKHLSGVKGHSVLSEAVVANANIHGQELEDRYAALLKTRTDALPGMPRYVIDKMPLNFLYLGFIFSHMPQARVVVLRRHPMDAGLSNFRQLFALDYSYYNYSYDLADTGRYVASFESLLRHWEQLLGPRLLSVQYEDLVAGPEPEIRRLLARLELHWDPACLEFHKQGGAVATPSASQVREPLYSTAVGRWRRYGDALLPLRKALLDGGIAIPEP